MRSTIREFVYDLLLRATGERERLRLYRKYLKTQYLPSDKLRAYQQEALCALLTHAHRNCEFYRARFAASGFDPTAINSLERLSELPPLSKEDVQGRFPSLVASNIPQNGLIENFTGGSSGQPLRLYYDRARHESRAAATMRHDSWAGRQIGDRVACFWGAPADAPMPGFKARVRQMVEGRSLWLNTGNLRVDEFARFNELLFAFKPLMFIAYANALALYAQFVKDNGLPCYNPRGIITSAEVLGDDARKLIQNVFRCPIFNRYGCREVSVIASECEEHNGLHVMAEGLILEIVDENDNPVNDGAVGDILITDLLNYGMPLIRYRIGDRGSWTTGGCPCGRNLPRLASIDGRVTDFVVGSSNQLVSGVFLSTYVIAKRPSLGRVQIIQSRANEVLFRVQPGECFDLKADQQYLFGEMRRHLGNLTMRVEVVDEILPEPSGKILVCKSTCRLPGVTL